MSSAGTVPRAAVPVSDARADASRRNGAKSLDPKTETHVGRAAHRSLPFAATRLRIPEGRTTAPLARRMRGIPARRGDGFPP